MSSEIKKTHDFVESGMDLNVFNTADSPSPIMALPPEIWAYIFSFAATSSTPWSHIVNYARVSKQFLAYCLKNIKRYAKYHAIHNLRLPKNLKPMPSYPLQEVTQLGKESQFVTLANQYIGSTERCYLHSLSGKKSMLYILNSSPEGFEWISIDVKEIARKKFQPVLEEQGLSKDHWYNIVNCHPTSQGFVLVTHGGVSQWHYNETSNVPECSAFYAPKLLSDDGPRILRIVKKCYQSTYHEGILHLTLTSLDRICKDENLDFFEINLNHHAPKFKNLSLEKNNVFESRKFKMYQTPKPEFLALTETESRKEKIFVFQKMKIAESYTVEKTRNGVHTIPQIDYQRVGEPFTLTTQPYSLINNARIVNNLLLFSLYEHHVNYLRIFDCETFSCWGEELKLIYPNPQWNEHLFLTNDFLFLFYKSTIRVIHLTSKKEFTEKLKPFLQPYLNEKSRMIGIHYHDEHFQILLQTETSSGNFILQSVKIPLNLSDDEQISSPNEISTTAPIKDSETPLTGNDNVHVFSQETIRGSEPLLVANTEPKVSVIHSTSLCKTLDGRIVIIAGVALILVALAATLALVFTHPGTILVQHHSFVLTVPTVVTFAAGEGVALIVVFIGIYFYKRRPAENT